jgi:hypothetical protein
MEMINKGLATEIPPNPAHVLIYFDQQEMAAEAERFYQHHQATGWLIKNWKTAAAKWIWEIKLKHPYLRLK